INDLKFLGMQPVMIDDLVSLVRSNLLAIVDDCQRHQCRVILLEVWPAGEPPIERRLVWNSAIAESGDRLNGELRVLHAPQEKVHVVDLFERAGISPGPEQFRDTLHFKPETYERLTAALKDELRAVLPE